MRVFAALLSTFVSVSAVGCIDGNGFVPANKLNIPANGKGLSSTITEESLQSIINKISAVYQPLASDEGGNLVITPLWKSGSVNAMASRVDGKWKVDVYGGFARHPAITEDALALAICHEVGHHIGGAPKLTIDFGENLMWGSGEGQSDYFSTLKCFRRVFAHDDNAAAIALLVIPEVVKTQCQKSFRGKADRAICIRSAMAGLTLSHMLHEIGEERRAKPSFDTPSSNEPMITFHGHPAAQCRLDTFFQGALCKADERSNVSQTNAEDGTCYADRGDTVGLRPRCWFAL